METLKSNITHFDFNPHTRIVFGEDRVNHIGGLAKELGGNHVLLVTDPGIEQAGHMDRVRQSLESEHLKITLFDQVIENPTTDTVERCTETARQSDIDIIVGLGGGSSIDTARGCNFLLTNGGHMQDYWGVGKARKPMLPMIAIPTTAGTGSECQSFALISDKDTHQKMACGDPKAAAKVALLDPRLTLSQPKQVAVCTGLDAMAHALESAVTKKRNPISSLFSKEAFRLTQAGLPRILETPNDLEARGQMLLGAAYAGLAIENSMLGAAHASANPLTAHYGIVHGQAVALMLPHVIRFNGKIDEIKAIYDELALHAGLMDNSTINMDSEEIIAQRIETIMDHAEMPRTLSHFDILPSDFNKLASEAAQQWTGRFNPKEVSANDFEGLYKLSYF